MTTAEIERIKLRANGFNALAVALFTAGILTPLFTFALGNPMKFDLYALIGLGVLCGFLAWVLHMIGYEYLGEIE
ncbi:hypothetical protein EAS62_12335 [Bradyrhizobium zhanjiangense]|uniref:Amino acid transporter protein n=1 Tax=Bradyrhizobium zhanjiangense TaxID=1325107 RepID=A0ABY0DN06_9BRAD|nr:hypothetical protein EAS62_12335 [Bradyrhizobium zhanjiangense]